MTLDTRWINEHYEFAGGDLFRCKRCGQPVGYLTKHARERHGDPIEVLPVKVPALADKW
jgi:hypothetical protein